MSEYIDFANTLADQAGEIMLRGRRKALQVRKKLDRTLVTNIDIEINRLVIDQTHEAYPRHGVRGEEESHNPDTHEVWIVDPLDGTTGYIEGRDSSVFGLALRRGNKLELGLVDNPFRDERFIALRGLGAFLNGRRIKVNQEQFEPGIAYDYCYWEGAQPDARIFQTEIGPPLSHDSALYQACKVAQGESAFTVFPGEGLHDVAAGSIMVEEAEGYVRDTRSRPHQWRAAKIGGAVLSNRLVHSEVMRHLGR